MEKLHRLGWGKPQSPLGKEMTSSPSSSRARFFGSLGGAHTTRRLRSAGLEFGGSIYASGRSCHGEDDGEQRDGDEEEDDQAVYRGRNREHDKAAGEREGGKSFWQVFEDWM